MRHPARPRASSMVAIKTVEAPIFGTRPRSVAGGAGFEPAIPGSGGLCLVLARRRERPHTLYPPLPARLSSELQTCDYIISLACNWSQIVS